RLPCPPPVLTEGRTVLERRSAPPSSERSPDHHAKRTVDERPGDPVDPSLSDLGSSWPGRVYAHAAEGGRTDDSLHTCLGGAVSNPPAGARATADRARSRNVAGSARCPHAASPCRRAASPGASGSATRRVAPGGTASRGTRCAR